MQSMTATKWYLVLIVWGDKYPDQYINSIIFSTMRHSPNCAGAIVFSDRVDRTIDPRGQIVPIPNDFSSDAFKAGGYPIKICMFDVPGVPDGTPCIYLDLDSVVIGSLDKLIGLLEHAPIWTIDVFPRRFSMFFRLLHRLSEGKKFAVGNSSALVYLNKFSGNPTEKFRAIRNNTASGTLYMHDDKFIASACQQEIRGLPTEWVAYFRIEYLAPTLWLAHVKNFFRKAARQEIVIVTFAGPLSKLDDLIMSPEGSVVRDHHGRVGIWSDAGMSGLLTAVKAEREAFQDYLHQSS